MSKSIKIVILLFFSLHLKAQTLSVGPMVGGNVSTFSGVSNSKSLAGIALGAFGNYSINESVGINAKLLYSQLGSAFENTAYLNRLHYVQLPITGVYFMGDRGQKLRPKIFAGPYIANLLGAAQQDGVKISNENGGPDFAKLDFGGVVGLGFNYRIQTKTWLNVDLSFNQGFTDINNSASVTNKNRAVNLNIGLSFPVN